MWEGKYYANKNSDRGLRMNTTTAKQETNERRKMLQNIKSKCEIEQKDPVEMKESTIMWINRLYGVHKCEYKHGLLGVYIHMWTKMHSYIRTKM